MQEVGANKCMISGLKEEKITKCMKNVVPSKLGDTHPVIYPNGITIFNCYLSQSAKKKERNNDEIIVTNRLSCYECERITGLM
jgi:hypothetical protein